MGWFEGLIFGRLTGALEQTAAFTQARQKILAENIANIDTPGYRRKKVDLRSFQQALQDALKRCRANQPLPDVTTRQVYRDEAGRLRIRPEVEPPDNVMFHDRTNGRIERDMAEMAENLLLHQVTVELLRQRYHMLEIAIKGRTV